MSRYTRNLGTLTPLEMLKVQNANVAVVGCGGLGGYVLEMLGRLGVGSLTAIDGDVFEESNLNRQLLSQMALMGTSKAVAARERMREVNPEIGVKAIHQWLTAENAPFLLRGHAVIVDALDSIPARLMLQEAAAQLGTPLVHGAIGGWYGQVTVVFPEDRTLDRLYGSASQAGVEKKLGNPSFTPALVASIQAAETVKLLIGRGELLRNRVLRIDLLEQEYTLIDYAEAL